jgi:hypothetical protein
MEQVRMTDAEVANDFAAVLEKPSTGPRSWSSGITGR